MKKSPFTYERPATREQIGELYDSISPLEPMPLDLSRELFVAQSLMASASYAVKIDARLAGICFVLDRPGRRVMAFTKTAYLTTSRRITFARSIPALLADIARYERRRMKGRPPTPLYFHTPQGDDRSRDWFVAAGCTPTQQGLLCPE